MVWLYDYFACESFADAFLSVAWSVAESRTFEVVDVNEHKLDMWPSLLIVHSKLKITKFCLVTGECLSVQKLSIASCPSS
jgi:hypothetical protein